MAASLHISGTSSSTLDSVFICRSVIDNNENHSFSLDPLIRNDYINSSVASDIEKMSLAGVKTTIGDKKCLLSAHIARQTINSLSAEWDLNNVFHTKIEIVKNHLESIRQSLNE